MIGGNGREGRLSGCLVVVVMGDDSLDKSGTVEK